MPGQRSVDDVTRSRARRPHARALAMVAVVTAGPEASARETNAGDMQRKRSLLDYFGASPIKRSKQSDQSGSGASAMAESRLNDLAVLSIERDLSKTLDLNAVIQNFAANNKNRRIALY